MKTKILTVLAMLTCATLVSAQSFDRIYVNIAQGTATDQLRVVEAPTFTAGFDNNYDVVKMLINNDIYIYAMAPDQSNAVVPHSKVYTDDLNSLVIGYRATAAGTATITFSDLKSDLEDVTTFFLLDTKTNNYTAIGEGASDKYVFEAEAGDFPKRFKLIKPVPSVCFRYNELEVIGYAGKKLVIKDAATDTEIVNIASLEAIYFKDLSDKHGRLIVELDGKKILIDATPDVTPAN